MSTRAGEDAKARRWGADLFAFGLGFALAFRPIAGMDAPWHLAMGAAHLDAGPWLDVDPISWVPAARPSDMGAWLGQALFALAERLGGLGLARALVAAVAGALLVVVRRATERRVAARLPDDGSAAARVNALVALAVALVAALALHRFRLRPDVFSLLMAFVVLDLLDREELSRRRDLALLAACALWTNLHPGVVVAPVLAAAATARHRFRAGWSAVLACAIGASLRPRGPLDLIDLAAATARTGGLVPEWQPLWRLDAATFAGEWILLVAIVAGGLVLVRRAVATRREEGALLATAAILLGARAVRLLYFAGFGAMKVLERFAVPLTATALRRRALLATAILVVVAMPLRDRVAAGAAAREAGLSPWADLYEPNYPVRAARVLAGLDLEGRLFHPVKWGGYLGRELAPRYRSAHDGRITYFGFETARDLLRFAVPAAREELVDRWQLEILVVPPDLLGPDEILGRGQRPEGRRRWIAVHADPVAAIFIDARGPHAAANLRALTGR